MLSTYTKPIYIAVAGAFATLGLYTWVLTNDRDDWRDKAYKLEAEKVQFEALQKVLEDEAEANRVVAEQRAVEIEEIAKQKQKTITRVIKEKRDANATCSDYVDTIRRYSF